MATPDLEDQAHQAYVDGDIEGAVGAWEALHLERRDAGDPTGSAQAAAMVAMHLLMDSGLMAPVRGWVRRAERLLAEEPDTSVHALLHAVRTYERFMCGDLAASAVEADLAIAAGERHGVVDAAVIGETARARLALLRGEVHTGLALLEEVGARLMSGEAGDLVTGMMLCEVVCAAQGLAMHDLAREWTEVMERWRHGSGFGTIHGRCRVHRAELMRLSGPLAVAEDEALAACEALRPWLRREYGWPLVELGTVRLRRGDLVGAEAAFVDAESRSWSPEPGLALVRLAQGRVAEAARRLDDAVDHPVAIPSKEQPPSGDLRLAPLLDARSRVASAAADAPAATAAATRLAAIAAGSPSQAVVAMAAAAAARAALLRADPVAGEREARRAVALWAGLGAPYEGAEARLVLADCLLARGDRPAAERECEVAAGAATALGAEALARTARERQGQVVVPVRPAERAVFALSGSIRRVQYDGAEASLPDLKGFRYLAVLLAHPGHEHHVVDLVATDAPGGSEDAAARRQEGLPVLDEEARAAYRRRLREVDEDLAEAEACHDLGRAELAGRDRDYLLAELAGAFGLGGRARAPGGAAERARTAVARSLRYSLSRLAAVHPLAAAHLEGAVRTGAFCRYAPDPTHPVVWQVE